MSQRTRPDGGLITSQSPCLRSPSYPRLQCLSMHPHPIPRDKRSPAGPSLPPSDILHGPSRRISPWDLRDARGRGGLGFVSTVPPRRYSASTTQHSTSGPAIRTFAGTPFLVINPNVAERHPWIAPRRASCWPTGRHTYRRRSCRDCLASSRPWFPKTQQLVASSR